MPIAAAVGRGSINDAIARMKERGTLTHGVTFFDKNVSPRPELSGKRLGDSAVARKFGEVVAGCIVLVPQQVCPHQTTENVFIRCK